MAIGLPFQDQSWSPAGAPPEGTPAADGRSERQPGSPTEGPFDLGLVRAVIQDGLLMVFGPDGDPIPPEIFRAAAAEQPDAGIQLRDGLQVAAERVAAVLDAQTRGDLGSGRDTLTMPGSRPCSASARSRSRPQQKICWPRTAPSTWSRSARSC